MSEHDKDQMRKLRTVIEAALASFPCSGDLRISTIGSDPQYTVTISAYFLRDNIREEEPSP